MEHDADQINELARSLDYFSEEDFRRLAAITLSTALSWRKRGQGPRCVRLGNRYLYPKDGVREFLKAAEKERPAVTAEGCAMTAIVADLAVARYRKLIGKRCTLPLPDGRTITGKVLRGTAFEGTRFRLRARETHYLLMQAALLLRVTA